MSNEIEYVDGVGLAFLIEEAQDEWVEGGKWKTRERAAAEAVLARFWLRRKPDPVKVGDYLNGERAMAALPNKAVLVDSDGEVFQVCAGPDGGISLKSPRSDQRTFMTPRIEYKLIWLPEES